MRGLVTILLGVMLLTGQAALSAEAETWLEQLDVPLADGLVEDAEAGTLFESATGRVVIVEAKGAVAARSIERYYEQVLPELGWRAAGGNRFLRDGEALNIAITRANGLTLVVFRLSPAG